MSLRHASEVFQSSRTSWSSKIIELARVDRSQRTVGSLHDSRYSWVYSSKLATCVFGSRRMSRRRLMKSWISGEVSSA